MSYILDALNKAERERRRGSVPTLEADAVSVRRSPRLAWSWLLVVALLANALVYWWMQTSPNDIATSSPAPRVASGELGAASQPVEAPIVPPSTDIPLPPDNGAEPAAPSAQIQTTPSLDAPTPPAGPKKPDLGPPSPEVRGSPLARTSEAKARPAGHEATVSAAGQPASAMPGESATAPSGRPPEPQPPRPVPVMQPPTPAPKVQTAHPAPSREPVEAAAGETLTAPQAPEVELLQAPLLEQLPASFRDSLPELRIDALVFSETPSNRMVFIKGRKYREGDTVEGQARVEQIRRDGVILDHQGTQFMVQP